MILDNFPGEDMSNMLQRKVHADLKVHWRQFFAVWLVLVMGTAFYGAFYPAGKSLLQTIYTAYDDFNYMDVEVRLPFGMPLSKLDEVREVSGVQAASGRLVLEAGIQLQADSSFLTHLRLIGLPEVVNEEEVNRSEIVEGRAIEADDEVLLLKRFADYHHIRPGDTVAIWLAGEVRRFRVAGLVFNPEYLVGGRDRESPFPTPSAFGVAWLSHHALAEWANVPGIINQIVVRSPNPAAQIVAHDRTQLVEQLTGWLEDQPQWTIWEREQTASGGVIQANITGNFQVMAAFSAMFLLAAVVVTAILLGRMVQSQRQQIGTLRALGVTRFELVRHFLSFGLLLGLAGAIPGSLLGYGLSFLTMWPFVDAIAGGYLPNFNNAPQIPFILLGAVVIVVSSTLAGAYPAWRESGTPPGIALRPPTPHIPSALSRISFGFLSLSLRQMLRNVLRAPGRSLATWLGIWVGTVMIFSSVVLLNSMVFSFGDYFASQQYDLLLVNAALTPDDGIETQVRDVAGVQDVQAALFGPVTVKAGQQEFDTLAFVVDEQRPFFDLTLLRGEEAFSSSDGVWVGHNLARVLHLEVGQTIAIRALEEERQVRILGIVAQAFGSPVFVPRRLFVAWTPDGQFPTNVALVRTHAGMQETVREQLALLPGAVSVQDHAAYVRDINDYLSFWYVNSALFAVFGALLTMAVILNTVNASLHERQSELAILRSLGVLRREVIVSVLVELLLLTAIAMMLGVPAGLMVGSQMVHSVDMDFYGLVVHLEAFAAVGCGLLVVALVVFSALPGLRTALNAELGQVSKRQSI